MITAALIAMFWLGTASGVLGAVLIGMSRAAAPTVPVTVTGTGTVPGMGTAPGSGPLRTGDLRHAA